jgi:outer membrane biosynthesis protein TonB
MDRAERNGFAVALVGHVLLFGALSLGLLTARIPKPPIADSMDVTITDKVGLTSAAPKVATEAPAPSEAPDQGAPEESAPPPPEPEPEPSPPKPAPPKPAPPKPAPPKPKPEKPKPEKPTPPKPEPKPVPKPEPKPEPEKQQPKPKPEKPKPEKAKPEKAKPQKAAPDTSESSASKAKPTPAKHHAGLPSDFLSDLPGDAPGKGKAEKAKGSRLGKDFLKGLAPDKSPGKASAPHAAAVSQLALNGLAALIAQQVKPCYNPPTGGADSASIVTLLDIRMQRDGSVASVNIDSQSGGNPAYNKQAGDAAKRAVLRCAPLHLPPELYDVPHGWADILFRFRPDQMQ